MAETIQNESQTPLYPNDQQLGTLISVDRYGNPIISNTALNPINTTSPAYTLRLDETSDPLYTYIGEAQPGSSESDPVWRIKRMTNADTTILYVEGLAAFDYTWDDRLSLSFV